MVPAGRCRIDGAGACEGRRQKRKDLGSVHAAYDIAMEKRVLLFDHEFG
jgi:hypothetical protein